MLRSPQFSLPLLLSGLLCLLFLSACRHPQEDILAQQQQLEQRWSKPQTDPYTQPLSWSQAHALLLQHNSQWQRSCQSVVKAKHQIKQVYLDLLPRLDGEISLTESINQLNKLTWANLRYDLRGTIALPGVLQFNKKLYAARLAYLKALALNALTYREITTQLYQIFLQEEAQYASTLAALDRTASQLTQQTQTQLARQQFINEVNQLFSLQQSQWQFLPHTRPQLPYRQQKLPIHDPLQTGRLHRELIAIDLAASLARIRGIEFQYWPDWSSSLSGGSLFRRSNGESSTWDADNTFLSTRLRFPIDINQRIRSSLISAQLDHSMLENEIHFSLEDTLYQLTTAQDTLATLEIDHQTHQQKIDILNDLAQKNLLLPENKTLQTIQNLQSEKQQLLEQSYRIEILLWTFDDAQWDAQYAPIRQELSQRSIDQAQLPTPSLP